MQITPLRLWGVACETTTEEVQSVRFTTVYLLPVLKHFMA